MQLFKISFTSGDFKSGTYSYLKEIVPNKLRQFKPVSNDSFIIFLHDQPRRSYRMMRTDFSKYVCTFRYHIFKTNSVIPIYFSISDTSNSLAISSRSFIKLSMLVDFRANVLNANVAGFT